ncbi:predicted protein [Plenodomus lingam JN3]|uniref:Predicted protein n=1 Tax=Leptosphaeria maculans (strain JN3 / isolate v23.1.3 / race Av1-4-5-6-7-8) TaxID=985895 RepID=E5AD55_LEPMJ|nr:predicted protein [Plenodomus lingam JN3]CBY02407.1 predicted protein [Plenodomus lingam JN3]
MSMATHGTRRYLTRSCGQTGTGYGAALDDGQLCTLHVLALVSRVVSLVESRASVLAEWPAWRDQSAPQSATQAYGTFVGTDARKQSKAHLPVPDSQPASQADSETSSTAAACPSAQHGCHPSVFKTGARCFGQDEGWPQQCLQTPARFLFSAGESVQTSLAALVAMLASPIRPRARLLYGPSLSLERKQEASVRRPLRPRETTSDDQHWEHTRGAACATWRLEMVLDVDAVGHDRIIVVAVSRCAGEASRIQKGPAQVTPSAFSLPRPQQPPAHHTQPASIFFTLSRAHNLGSQFLGWGVGATMYMPLPLPTQSIVHAPVLAANPHIHGFYPANPTCTLFYGVQLHDIVGKWETGNGETGNDEW